jgi:hypothetical protein
MHDDLRAAYMQDVANLLAENQRLRNEVCRLEMALRGVYVQINQALDEEVRP